MSSEGRRAAIDVTVERCGEDCPFHHVNNCADEGIDYSCEANDHVNLDKYFETRFHPFSRVEVPAFPKNCPLEKVEDLPIDLTQFNETMKAAIEPLIGAELLTTPLKEDIVAMAIRVLKRIPAVNDVRVVPGDPMGLMVEGEDGIVSIKITIE